MRVKDEQRFREARSRRKFSQRDLAYLAKCSQNSISLIERGLMRTLSEDLALTLAERLDVPWEDLFEVRAASHARRVTGVARTKRQEKVA